MRENQPAIKTKFSSQYTSFGQCCREEEEGQQQTQTQLRVEDGSPMSHLSSGENEANPSGSGEQTTPLSDSKDGGKSTGDELEVTSDGNEGKIKKSKRRSSKASTIKGSGRPSSAASSRQPIQKVVYYQNRFITVSIDPVTGKVVETGGPVLNAVGPGGAGSVTGRAVSGNGGGFGGGGPGHRDTSSTKGGVTRGTGGNMSAIEKDTMQQDPYPGGSGGIAGRPSGNMGSNQAGKAGKFGQFKVPSCLRTCLKYLQDNRLETGSAKTKEKLKDNNKTQDQTNMCLKKVLNIIFVTTGVSLFLTVVIVIIYTSIGK